MRNSIGIFICNYNGKEWVMKCLRSLFEQSFRQFDIYVVDNASTDGTVESILDKYEKKVSVIRNAENMGGSGGFGRGLKTGSEKGYQYIVLLDNDIILDKEAIKNMRDVLEANEDVGIVGSKVMILDRPDIIQDFGGRLDFKKYRELPEYGGERDQESLPAYNECDYVPTCAVMVRTKALRVSGTMPEDNFIYYDDIELSHKMVLQGYRIVASGNVKVWHKGGFRKGSENTFSKYYFLRNRLHFFAKYIPEEDVDQYMETILSEVFSQLYGYYNKGMKELYQTTVYALDDFLHEVRGKAEDCKIMQITDRPTPFERVISGKKHIRIFFLDDFQSFLCVVRNIQKKQPQSKIWVSLEQCACRKDKFMDLLREAVKTDRSKFQMPEVMVSEESADMFDLELRMCEHVNLVETSVLPQVYVDKYCNCITSNQDYEYFRNFRINRSLFMEMYRPLTECAIKKIREKAGQNAG